MKENELGDKVAKSLKSRKEKKKDKRSKEKDFLTTTLASITQPPSCNFPNPNPNTYTILNLTPSDMSPYVDVAIICSKGSTVDVTLCGCGNQLALTLNPNNPNLNPYRAVT